MDFHITVEGESEAEENEAIKKIASHLIRSGVRHVIVVADGEQTEYKDEGAAVSTPSVATIFKHDPEKIPLAIMLAHKR